jgi:hypothetical protein
MKELEQVEHLMRIMTEGHYGAILLIRQQHDDPYVQPIVPVIAHYEIFCSKDGQGYDVWASDELVEQDQPLETVCEWLRDNSPEWIYDDTPEYTDSQWRTMKGWLREAEERQDHASH